MEIDFTVFYVEANIVSMIIFLMMFFRETRVVGWQTKQRIFINITVAHMLYFLVDICGTLLNAGYLPPNRISTMVVNIGIAVLLSIITGSWFVYTELSQGENYIKKFKARLLALVPAMSVAVVIPVLFLAFPETVMDGKGKATDLYYVLFMAVPALYIVVSSVRSFIRAFRKENYAVKTQYLVCAIYPLIITVFGVLETLWTVIPMFCFGTSIIMLYIYIISLNDQVSIDELTKLNNRTQLKKYIVSEHSKQGGDKIVHYILLIDLNKFKHINDEYGHLEGDKALKRTADALKLSCSDNPMKTFIARYGGDEFIVVAKTENEELVKELKKVIKDTLVRLNIESGAEYELSASIGYASYCGDVSDFQAALSKADEALYEEKAKRAAPTR